MSQRQQSWSDDEAAHGRIVLLSRNPVSEAIETIAGAVGREVVVVADDEGGRGVALLGQP